MDPLSVLPPELTLRVLGTLQIADLAALQVVCQSWNTFISLHEDPIYRIAAGYVPSVSLPDLCHSKAANTAEHNYWTDATTWKTYCASDSRIDQGSQPNALQVDVTSHCTTIWSRQSLM